MSIAIKLHFERQSIIAFRISTEPSASTAMCLACSSRGAMSSRVLIWTAGRLNWCGESVRALRSGGNARLCFRIEDIQAARAELATKDVRVGPVEEKTDGLVTFCDPEGKRALAVAMPLIVLASTKNSPHGTSLTALEVEIDANSYHCCSNLVHGDAFRILESERCGERVE
jgi:hypothetical protein